ncbi:hypothetical protein J6590_084313 [Homalodisca vitripennis]|nr:hypothetical protein J6590_084313 [Homalodisca vitripennis]
MDDHYEHLCNGLNGYSVWLCPHCTVDTTTITKSPKKTRKLPKSKHQHNLNRTLDDIIESDLKKLDCINNDDENSLKIAAELGTALLHGNSELKKENGKLSATILSLEAKLESVVEENERLNKAHEELHQLISEKDRQLQKEISLRKKEQEMYVDYDNEQSLTIFKLEENIDALKLEISKKKSEYVENDPVKCSVQSQCEIIKQSGNDISDGLFSCGFNALKRTIERLDSRVRDLEEKSISGTMKTCVAPVPEKLVEFTPSLVSSPDQTCWKPQSTPPVGAQPLKPDETIEEFFEANIQKYRVCNPANRTNRSLSPANPTVEADEDGSPTQNPNPHFLCNTSTAKAGGKSLKEADYSSIPN